MTEIKDITSLTPAPYNPRTMSNHDANSLEQSITKFGDISGITKGVTTGHIITGNQRTNTLVKKFGADRVKIHIEHTQEPDEFGTVATGFVVVEGTNIRLSYREIKVSPEIEKVININANRVEAQWNIDLLGEINAELAQLENAADLLKQTGQTEDEIESMLKMNGAIDDTPEQPKDELDQNKLEFALTADQREIVEEAIGNIKATRELQAVQPRNLNGAALFTLCQDFLNKLHNKQEAPIGGIVDSNIIAIVGEQNAPEQPNSISIA